MICCPVQSKVLQVPTMRNIPRNYQPKPCNLPPNKLLPWVYICVMPRSSGTYEITRLNKDQTKWLKYGFPSSKSWTSWYSLGTSNEYPQHMSQRTKKTYNKICVTRKDSDQPVYPPSIARVLVYASLDSLKAAEGTCDRRKLWSDCAYAQADLSLRRSHVSYCRFWHTLVHIFSWRNNKKCKCKKSMFC